MYTKFSTTDAEQSNAVSGRDRAGMSDKIKTTILRLWICFAALMLLGIVHFNRADISSAYQPVIQPFDAARHEHDRAARISAERGKQHSYLSAPGTVMPFATVAVRTRVDGELIRVYFNEGQTVRVGDPLAEIDPRPYQVQLTEAEGQMARDRASLVNAQAQFARFKELFAENIVARQDLDSKQALAGEYAGIVRNDQGMIDGARLNLGYCRIASPISGRVGLRLVDPGNIVHSTDGPALMVITQVQPIAVIINLPEDDLSRVVNALRKGSTLPVEAYDRSFKNQLASGTLVSLDNEIDRNTRTAKLKAIFTNEDSALFPNQFVNTRLLLNTTSAPTIGRTASDAR